MHINQSLPLTAVLALGLSLAGCSSPLAQRAQRADGLLGFIFDSPGPDLVPVQRVSKGGGEIATAHTVADGSRLRVSGLVRKAGLHDPPYGSHIDVLVLDARGKITAAAATEYFPRQFPRRIRGNMGNSHYGTRLPFIPAAGSMVQVIFHGAKAVECPYAQGS